MGANIDANLDINPSQASSILRDDYFVFSDADLTVKLVDRGRRGKPPLSLQNSYMDLNNSLFQLAAKKYEISFRKRKISAISTGFYNGSSPAFNNFTHISIDLDDNDPGTNYEDKFDGDAQPICQNDRDLATHMG